MHILHSVGEMIPFPNSDVVTKSLLSLSVAVTFLCNYHLLQH